MKFLKILFFQIKSEILTSEILWGEKDMSTYFSVTSFEASALNLKCFFPELELEVKRTRTIVSSYFPSISCHKRFVKNEHSFASLLGKAKDLTTRLVIGCFSQLFM